MQLLRLLQKVAPFKSGERAVLCSCFNCKSLETASLKGATFTVADAVEPISVWWCMVVWRREFKAVAMGVRSPIRRVLSARSRVVSKPCCEMFLCGYKSVFMGSIPLAKEPGELASFCSLQVPYKKLIASFFVCL